MEFFNINFKNKREAGSIGIIDGTDRPTSIYIAKTASLGEYPEEKLGLEMKAYRLPGIESEVSKENKFINKNQSASRISSYTDEDVIVEME